MNRAIELFDKAQYHGSMRQLCIFLMQWCKRKLKDYDNEISILDEAIERLKREKRNNETRIMEFNERRAKALTLKCR